MNKAQAKKLQEELNNFGDSSEDLQGLNSPSNEPSEGDHELNPAQELDSEIENSVESSLSAESETNSVSSEPGEDLIEKWKTEFHNNLSFPFKYSQKELRNMEQDYINTQIQKMRNKKHENFAAMLHRALKPKSKQVLRIQPYGVYNLTESFIKNGEISKSLFSYKIKLFDQVINFGRIHEIIDSEEKEWFGKKGGKKPRKGPAKKKKGKGGDQEEGIWTEEI